MKPEGQSHCLRLFSLGGWTQGCPSICHSESGPDPELSAPGPELPPQGPQLLPTILLALLLVTWSQLASLQAYHPRVSNSYPPSYLLSSSSPGPSSPRSRLTSILRNNGHPLSPDTALGGGGSTGRLRVLRMAARWASFGFRPRQGTGSGPVLPRSDPPCSLTIGPQKYKTRSVAISMSLFHGHLNVFPSPRSCLLSG